MSHTGAPATAATDGDGLLVTVVAGTWHPEVADGLVAGALAALEEAGAVVSLVRVAGSFELPVTAAAALRAGADAVVALGVIIRGETPHFDFVARAATDGLTRVALDAGRPVGFGLLTVDDEAQARDRAGLPGARQDVGREAAAAAVQTALRIRELSAALPRA